MLKKAMKQKDIPYAVRLFKDMSYANARTVYSVALPAEQKLFGPILDDKRSRLVKKDGKAAVAAIDKATPLNGH
jgi:hypothetical protein